jgi:hypothetical protein
MISASIRLHLGRGREGIARKHPPSKQKRYGGEGLTHHNKLFVVL